LKQFVRFRDKATGRYVHPAASGSQNYDAGSTRGRRGKIWQPSSAGPNAALTYALPVLVNRSRAAVRDNPYAEAAINSLVTNAIGTGIKPQWQTSDAGLNRELAALWLRWTDEADADGLVDWYGLQALALRAVAEAGEVFARARVRRDGDLETVPLQVQLLEPEFCPANEFRFTRPGREVRNGIEFDMRGQRTAYLMYRQHPNDWTSVGGLNDLTLRPIPASEIEHVYQPRRPGQIRGEPWLTRALIKLKSLDDYDDAELERKKTAALFAAFVTAERPQDFEFGGETPADGSTVAEGAPPADSDQAAQVTLESGTVQVLAEGEDVKFSDPTEVGTTYEPFMRQQLRAVAVAAGTMYELLTGDFSQVNDRTYRASVNEFRRRVEMLQHGLIVHQFCRPVAWRWANLAVLSGAIKLPRRMDPMELRRIRWVPQGWKYIHPVQEVQAHVLEMDNLLRSRADVVSERGEDVADVDREIAEDKAREEQLGIARVGKSSAPQQEREHDEGPEARQEMANA